MAEVLTVKRTGAPENHRISMLLAGQPGAGKTKTAATFPNCLFASAEAGLMSIQEQNIPYVDITSIDQLFALKVVIDQDRKAREEAFGFPIDTVVIDTIDEIQRILIRERLDETKQDSMKLQDWGWAKEQMTAIIRGFRNIVNVNIVFTVHLADKTEQNTGRMYARPGLQGAIADEIAAYVDLAVVLRSYSQVDVVDGEARKSVRRVLQTMPDENFDWIKDRSGKVTSDFPINFKDDYQRIYDLVYANVDTLPAPVESVVQQDGQPAVVEPIEAAERIEAVKERGTAKSPLATAKPEEVFSEPETEPEHDLPVPEEETPEPEPKTVPEPEREPEEIPAQFGLCDECNNPIESEDQKDLSWIKYRQKLCKAHYAAKKNR